MTNLTALWMTLALGLFLLIGAGIVFLTKNNDKFVDFSISLAFSVVIMMILTDLIPEAYEIFGSKQLLVMFLWIVLGFVVLRVLDFFIPDHEDHLETTEDDDHNLGHIGLVSSIALILHNMIEGMAIYSTFTSSFSLGFLLSIGVGLHNIPLGMVITSAFYRSNRSRHKTILIVLGLSLSTFVGGLILFCFGGNLIGEMFLGMMLAITLGMLIYISLCELLPKMLHTKNKMISILGFVIGIVLLLITLLF